MTALIKSCCTFNTKQPSPFNFVMDNVRWGRPDVLYTPAYWQSQAKMQQQPHRQFAHRLGASLAEEVAACLLGGYGIPAEVGLAAFGKLKADGALCQPLPTAKELERLLREPINIGDRQINYRFAKQRAKYISESLCYIATHTPPLQSGKVFRDWLLQLPGIGFKTASWISRNWLGCDDVAIIDIHIYRAGIIMGLFPITLSLPGHYLELESKFLDFAQRIGIRASVLDAVMWQHMRESNELAIRLVASQFADDNDRGVRKVA